MNRWRLHCKKIQTPTHLLSLHSDILFNFFELTNSKLFDVWKIYNFEITFDFILLFVKLIFNIYLNLKKKYFFIVMSKVSTLHILKSISCHTTLLDCETMSKNRFLVRINSTLKYICLFVCNIEFNLYS